MSDRAYKILAVVMVLFLAFGIYAEWTGLFPDKPSPEDAAYGNGYGDGFNDGSYSRSEYIDKAKGSLLELLDLLNSTDMYGGSVPFEDETDAVTDYIYDAIAWMEKEP